MEKKKKKNKPTTILGHCSLEQGLLEPPPPAHLGSPRGLTGVPWSSCGQQHLRRHLFRGSSEGQPWVGERTLGMEERPLITGAEPSLEERWRMRVGCSTVQVKMKDEGG